MATFQMRCGEILGRVGFALRVLLSATLLAQIMLAPAANAHAFVGEVPSGNFPQTTAAVISAIEEAGEAANVVIIYTDDLTGNRVSKTWSELDPDTRDFLKGATFFIPTGVGLKIGRALPGPKGLTAPNRVGPDVTSAGRPINFDGEFYSADGFKFSSSYYDRLWANGRPAPFLQARSVLDSNPNIIPDPRGAPGYFKYEGAGLEMIYNPTTGQVGHIQPIR